MESIKLKPDQKKMDKLKSDLKVLEEDIKNLYSEEDEGDEGWNHWRKDVEKKHHDLVKKILEIDPKFRAIDVYASQLDAIASEIEAQDPVIAMALDKISDKIELHKKFPDKYHDTKSDSFKELEKKVKDSEEKIKAEIHAVLGSSAVVKAISLMEGKGATEDEVKLFVTLEDPTYISDTDMDRVKNLKEIVLLVNKFAFVTKLK